jgi:hypothetical protein
VLDRIPSAKSNQPINVSALFATGKFSFSSLLSAIPIEEILNMTAFKLI